MDAFPNFQKTINTSGAALEKHGEPSLRSWILVKIETSNARRPSGVFPLRGRCLLEEKTAWIFRDKGQIRFYGKTKGIITQVPVVDGLAMEILEWKEELRVKGKSIEPDDFMFHGRSGQPINPSIFRKRVLHILALDLSLPKLIFQVTRWTIATLVKSKCHVKDLRNDAPLECIDHAGCLHPSVGAGCPRRN